MRFPIRIFLQHEYNIQVVANNILLILRAEAQLVFVALYPSDKSDGKGYLYLIIV